MFDIKICGITEAGIWVNNNWPTKVISLINQDTELNYTFDDHLILRLDDVESQTLPDWIVPNMSHVDDVVDFTKDLTDDDKLLIHCHQGISRSTAMAIGVLISHHFFPQEAYDKITEVREFIFPNLLIIKLIDDKFNLNNELVDIVTEKRKEQMKRRLDKSISDDEMSKRSSVNDIKSLLEKLYK